MSVLELIQIAAALGLPTCVRCDPGDAQAVATMTSRFGGDCLHICQEGKSPEQLASEAIGPETDPTADYITVGGNRFVPVLAVASTHVLAPDGSLINF